jgi:uncharacterized radical SAM superfamily Fe-S cluster-containing enzyme
MAATIDHDCNECGERHALYLADSDMFTGNARYEFFCPKTGLATRFTSDDEEWDQVLQVRPKDSVEVRRV